MKGLLIESSPLKYLEAYGETEVVDPTRLTRAQAAVQIAVAVVDGLAVGRRVQPMGVPATHTAPYPRGQERVVAVVEPERQAVGVR